MTYNHELIRKLIRNFLLMVVTIVAISTWPEGWLGLIIWAATSAPLALWYLSGTAAIDRAREQQHSAGTTILHLALSWVAGILMPLFFFAVVPIRGEARLAFYFLSLFMIPVGAVVLAGFGAIARFEARREQRAQAQRQDATGQPPLE